LTIARFALVLVLASVGFCACDDGARGPSPSPTTNPNATVSLKGQVTSLDPAVRVPGATLTVIDAPNAGQSATTDGAGTFTFSGLQASVFTLSVTAVGYKPQRLSVTLTVNRTLGVSLQPEAAAITLTGQVTDAATGGAIAGAVVSINGRYRGSTDQLGHFSVSGLLDYGANSDFTYVSASDYVSDYRYIRGTAQNVSLHRNERIAVGESRLVTVTPNDSLCVNNVQDSPGIGPNYLCRTLFLVASGDGSVTVEAVSLTDGHHPPLEVEIVGGVPCCAERIGNPTTIEVTAGARIAVSVEVLATSASSQSFTVATSFSAR
jgi:hypothetical protein